MKILHLMLSNFYIDGVAYQENMLAKQNREDGHTVLIIASTEMFVEKNRLGYIKPGRYINEHGIEVIRLPYRKVLPHFIMRKVRAYPDVYRLIQEFSPDVILHHGVPAFELLTVAKYKKYNPEIRLYLDSHDDFHNSARNWLSKNVLHRLFYGPIVRKALPYVDKILCVNLETMDFLIELYGLPLEMMEFYPLGGVVFEDDERKRRRAKKRQRLRLKEEDVLMLHTGKLQKAKRTEELLTAFSQVNDDTFKLVIAGSIGDDIKPMVDSMLAKDYRIEYVGWQDVDSLYDLLCAADLYLQPGSQSATMQNALSCGCPVMLYPHKSHGPYINGNGFYVDTIADMVRIFEMIKRDKKTLNKMGKRSLEIANELLDYRMLAKRLYR